MTLYFMAGMNLPQLKLPKTKFYFGFIGIFAAILTPNLLPIFDNPQFQMILPLGIMLVSYFITAHRVNHHHRHKRNSHTHKSKGACFFSMYGTTFLTQILIQLNLISEDYQIPEF